MSEGNHNYIENAPNAGPMIESLRDIGYTFRTALADIIDNSIAANAKNVDLKVLWNNADPVLMIQDDGEGMTDDELVDAMKLGSRNPTDSRDLSDLGRFSLGLKTASFSQCRKLTVISVKGGLGSALRWDLDVVAIRNKWLVERLPLDDVKAEIKAIGASGTIVKWECIDRLIDTTDAGSHDRFLDQISQARAHLELVFHRFLDAKEKKVRNLSISLNRTPLVPFDPFGKSNPATQELPTEVVEIGGTHAKVTPYILPHHSKCSKEEHEKLAGSEGYVRNQGFYVYRNHRLIDHGTWYRLAPMSDVNRLARVQIDIGNDSDQTWKVDVKKSRVSPPLAMRNQLKRVIETITERSKKPYSKRQGYRRKTTVKPVWLRTVSNGQISYTINLDHETISSAIASLGEQGAVVTSIIRLIEATIPKNQLFSDMSSSPKEVDSKTCDKNIRDMITEFVRTVTCAGMNSEEIKKVLMVSEPFSQYPEVVDEVLEGVA